MSFEETIVSERKVLTEILELYKEHTFLWDSSHSLYGNKGVKELAINIMLEKYRLLVEDANADTLKKKIEIMRASYRREYKKVMRNKQHTPSLWYYNLMSFLDKQQQPIVTCQSDDEEGSQIIEAYQHPAKRTRTSTEFLTEHSDTEESIASKPNKTAETAAFGRTVGLQLGGLSSMQKTIAEKIISDVIYYARLDKLTISSSLINLNDDYYG